MKRKFPFLILLVLASCAKDKFSTKDTSCYPDAVGKILVDKCATSGCHNSQSSGNANGLDYSSWENMFKGGKNGSSVIPFSTDYSYMLYFCNPDSSLGISLEPKMPFNGTPLSTDEYMTLKNWIADGAPNCQGTVNFSGNPNRKKFYVCMQPCNKVAVFDAETRVIMRYINVGNGNGGPHQVRITPDGKYWCAVFYGGNILQVFRTDDDTEVGTISLGIGNPESWNTVSFTSDSKMAFVSNLASPGGMVAVVDLTTMTQVIPLGGMDYPHGTFVTNHDSMLYVTCQTGNILYKVHLKDELNQWSIDQVNLGNLTPSMDSHEITFSPDGSRYYLSCQGRSEVRVYNAADDQLITVIPVGVKPQEFSISEKNHWLFVSCTEDSVSAGNSIAQKGSIYVIDYNSNTVVTHLYPGYQPHGLAVDEDHNVVYVANLNYDGGPAPHHISACGGRNGYISIIDMNTLQLLNVTLPDGSQFTYKNEVLQFPYFIAYRK
jgi:DNA-binding beta-propeller fold protein YncE